MSAEQVAVAQLLQGLRISFEREVVALEHVLRAMDQEEAGGHDYRSGADFGAFAAVSIEILEQQVQLCLDEFEDVLEQLLTAEEMEDCRRPLVRVGADDSFQDVLRYDIATLEARGAALGRAEEELLEMSPEDVSGILPQSAIERLEEEIDRELRKLLSE